MPLMVSQKDRDLRFVAKTIKDNALNPAPVSGFHAQPDYWQETPRWRRVIERYDWGAVVYISDRSRPQHVTIVAVGKVDLVRGRISTDDGSEGFPVTWYEQMSSELAAEGDRSRTSFVIPECIGYHEFDYICDGGINPNTKQAEPACAWRDRCIGLQGYCVRKKTLPEQVLRDKDQEEIVQLTDRLKGAGDPVLMDSAHIIANSEAIKAMVEGKKATAKAVKKSGDQGNKNGPRTQRLVKPKEGSEHAKPTDLSPTVEARLTTMQRECYDYIRLIANVEKTKLADEGEALRGDLFTRDLTRTSRYIALFMSRGQGKKRAPVAIFRLMTAINAYHIQLPFDVKTAADSRGLPNVVKWSDGAFQCAVKQVVLSDGLGQKIQVVIGGIIQEQLAHLQSEESD